MSCLLCGKFCLKLSEIAHTIRENYKKLLTSPTAKIIPIHFLPFLIRIIAKSIYGQYNTDSTLLNRITPELQHTLRDNFVYLHRNYEYGKVQEWFNWHAWKACVLERVPRVRISPFPHYVFKPDASRKKGCPAFFIRLLNLIFVSIHSCLINTKLNCILHCFKYISPNFWLYVIVY